ncbi:Uncharacterised protein [Raoultella terrigena]|uniref:Uncharacterized protein n=1 Tax=Raoultella terrigena TaxID=577 RepID=A0A4U9CS01_RAOTE|nr:Uncharacterised protein [Raoultella terrigena]
MMRRLSLALALGVALAGCRSADVPPAAPSLQIPPPGVPISARQPA